MTTTDQSELTTEEHVTLMLTLRGKSPREIAKAVGRGVIEVQTELASAHTKLRALNRCRLIARALERYPEETLEAFGLVEPEERCGRALTLSEVEVMSLLLVHATPGEIARALPYGRASIGRMIRSVRTKLDAWSYPRLLRRAARFYPEETTSALGLASAEPIPPQPMTLRGEFLLRLLTKHTGDSEPARLLGVSRHWVLFERRRLFERFNARRMRELIVRLALRSAKPA